MEEIYDVAILGAGPCGLSAGIYCARYGLKTIIISKDTGGMANNAAHVENWPGFSGSGIELMQNFLEQTKKFGVEVIRREIVNINKDNDFLIQTSKNENIKAKAVIICLGTDKKKLNISGEDKFLGKGVSYCATCDGVFFKGKTIAIVGGRNSCAQTAIMMSDFCKKVYIVYRQNKLNCDDLLEMKIKNRKNIEMVYDSDPLRLEGNDFLEKMIVKDSKEKERELLVDGVFVEIGSIPATSIIKKMGVNTDEAGYIIVDEGMKTNVSGVFAGGDITAKQLRQILTSSSDGAVASYSAYKFLKEENKK
ncbi:MAG: FAD-dependent oxidoreductase [archaeon]